jgi:hypothetical protein
MHFISIKTVLSNHLSYVTIFHCFLRRSHKTGLTVHSYHLHGNEKQIYHFKAFILNPSSVYRPDFRPLFLFRILLLQFLFYSIFNTADFSFFVVLVKSGLCLYILIYVEKRNLLFALKSFYPKNGNVIHVPCGLNHWRIRAKIICLPFVIDLINSSKNLEYIRT